MPRIRAVCLNDKREVLFIIECEAATAMTAIDKAKRKIDVEFDYCFEADRWNKITIEVFR